MPSSIAALAFAIITLATVLVAAAKTARLNRETRANWAKAEANWVRVAELNRQAAANWAAARENWARAAEDWNRVSELQQQTSADLAAANLRKPN